MTNVHLRRQEKRVLHGLNLTVHPGEVHGLAGANGAGKTTTFLACVGLLPIHAGRIDVLGQDLSRAPRSILREVGFVQDEPFIYEHLTPTEFLFFSARLRGYPLTESEAAAWCDRFGLPRRSTLLKGCSLGMRRKTCIGAQLLHRPKLVFMDEPFNALDADSFQALRSVMAEMSNAGTAFLLASHRPGDLEAVCDNVSTLSEGFTVQEVANVAKGLT